MPPSRPPRNSPRSRPPVVAVACPSCGGTVAGVDLGRRTECRYCGTDLHLPTLDFRPPAPPLPAEVNAAPETPEARREYGMSIAIVLVVFAVLTGLVYFGAGEEHRRVPRTEVSPRVPCYEECRHMCPGRGEDLRVIQQMCDDCKRTRCAAD